MGRVSRYKKVKSIDPFAKKPSWSSDVGDTSCASLRRVKRRSKTAMKLKEQKMNKIQRRLRGKEGKTSGKQDSRKKSGGCNGWGVEDGYDLPPDGDDEFDISDLVGSVKKETNRSSAALETKSAQSTTSLNGAEEKWTRKIELLDLRGVSGLGSTSLNDKLSSSKIEASTKKKKCSANNTSNLKNDSSKMNITARTPTSEIIAACSNPKAISCNIKNEQLLSSSSALSKQEKMKAFMEQKKSKKRRRGNGVFDDGPYNDDSQFHPLKNEFSQKTKEKQQSSPLNTATKGHVIARNIVGDQVERPPIFSSLPRGASCKKKTNSPISAPSETLEDTVAKSQRIKKEQKALEALREKVVKQYAILRESRRSGNR